MTKKHIPLGLLSILATACEPISIEIELDQDTKDSVSEVFDEERDDEHLDESSDDEHPDFYPVEQDEENFDYDEEIDEEEINEEENFDYDEEIDEEEIHEEENISEEQETEKSYNEEIYDEETEEVEEVVEEEMYNEETEEVVEETCGDDFSSSVQIEHNALWIQTDYGQHSNPLNTGLYGSSEAAEILMAQNIDWDFVRMDEMNFHPEYLMHYDMIILYGQGHLGPLSDVDAAVLEYWVLQGGGLMYHTFHPTESTCNMLNSLPSSFGIQCIPDGSAISGIGTPTMAHPINNDIEEIVVLGGEQWDVQQPAQSIVEDASGNTLIAALEWGYGRVVGINDEWPLYNSGTGNADISEGDNYLMLDNAFCWLSGDCNEAQPLEGDFECNMSTNFILDVGYSQISLTDGCHQSGDEMVCDANPVYNETPDLELAADYCQDICNGDEECTGYFFQKHQNGHEICGFYSEVVNLDVGVWHNHQEGSRVCKKN